jgi:hypothetical protein
MIGMSSNYLILEFDPSFAGLSQGGNDSIHIIITNHKSTIYPAFTRAVIHICRVIHICAEHLLRCCHDNILYPAKGRVVRGDWPA